MRAHLLLCFVVWCGSCFAQTCDTTGSYPFVPVHSQLSNPDAVALVIGICEYRNGLPPVDYALADAHAIKQLLVETMGYDPNRILESPTSPSSGVLRSMVQQDLKAKVRPGLSDVFVYYSGHGAPNPGSGKPFLIAADYSLVYDPTPSNSYSLEDLQSDLAALRARSVTLVVDACFSGETDTSDRSGAPGRVVNGSGMAYVELPHNMLFNGLLITATGPKEIAYWDKSAHHGVLTNQLLKAFQGEAAQQDGRVTVESLKAYLDRTVPEAAVRPQHPQVLATDYHSLVVKLSDLDEYSRQYCTSYRDQNAEPASVIEQCTRALQGIRLKTPERADLYRHRGMASDDLADLAAAASDFNEAVRLRPDYFEAIVDVGVVLYEKGDLDGARREYDKALRLNPNYAMGLVDRCALYMEKHDWQLALQDCDAAIRVNPEFVLAYRDRGWVLLSRRCARGGGARSPHDCEEDFKQSIADFSKAVELAKQHSSKEYVLALRDRAEAEFQVYNSTFDWTESIHDDSKTNAMRDLDTAIDRMPQCSECWEERGEQDSYFGRYEEAARDYSECIRLNPTYDDCYGKRAGARTEMEQYDLALRDNDFAIHLEIARNSVES